MQSSGVPDSLNERRRAFLDFVRSYLHLLRRYAQRRLRYYQALGVLHPGELSADDLVNETAAAALRRLDAKPPALGYFPWFRRVADTVLRRYVKRAAQRSRSTVSLEEPVGETQDGEVIRLRDILPDPKQPRPEDILVEQELARRVENALNRLPDEWRECYLMATLDSLSPSEIAAIEGMPLDDVRQDIRMARDFLRDILQADAGDDHEAQRRMAA
jgi:RNA polymerase sigma factor (sigma-70 family)